MSGFTGLRNYKRLSLNMYSSVYLSTSISCLSGSSFSPWAGLYLWMEYNQHWLIHIRSQPESLSERLLGSFLWRHGYWVISSTLEPTKALVHFSYIWKIRYRPIEKVVINILWGADVSEDTGQEGIVIFTALCFL